MPKKSEKKTEKKPEEKPAEKLSQGEYEKKVIELAKAGITSEKIGEQLRRQGIHPKEYEKKISDILRKENLYTAPDVRNVEIKLENLKKHFEKNRQDKKALKNREKIFGNLSKLRKYYAGKE
ncbi:MAG: hypothetical protein KGH55_00175 [Nanoarchaeota archaeon]|nr:hypothetical protein [Nanoarchaeota archaeon]